MDPQPTTPALRSRLRQGLRDAMKARDQEAMAALRAALGLIENASAVAPRPGAGGGSEFIAGASAGTGTTEAAPRQVSDADLVIVLEAEVAQWEATAQDAERIGRDDTAAQLRAEIAVVRSVLDDAERPTS